MAQEAVQMQPMPSKRQPAARPAPAPAAPPVPVQTPRPPQPPQVGSALASLREQQGLSMDELSRRAGVSKSMLSQIERAQANPTVAVVWRLANALGVPLPQLLDGTAGPSLPPPIVTVARHETPTLRGPDPGCELRILGPIDSAGQMEWYELNLAPGAQLASQAHEPGTREHLSVLDGCLWLQVGEPDARPSAEAQQAPARAEAQAHGRADQGPDVRVQAGETARYAADQAHCLHNRGTTAARALLVVLHGG